MSEKFSKLSIQPNQNEAVSNHDFRDNVLTRFSKPVMRLISDPIQSTGTERFPQEGPNVIMFNHDGRYDFWSYPELWRKDLPDLVVKAVARIGILPIKPLDDMVMGKILQPVLIRTLMRIEDEWPEEKKQRAKERNRQALAELLEEIRRGISMIYAPTGTTKGDGHFLTPKTGAIKLTHTPLEASESELIRIVPSVAHYDYLAGTRNAIGMTRVRTYINFGDAYFHEPEFNSDGRYTDENRQQFNEKLMNSWRDLNTYSPTQIIGLILDHLLQNGNPSIHSIDLLDMVDAVIETLQQFDNLIIDEGLLNYTSRDDMVLTVYDRLIKKGYIDRRSRKVNSVKFNLKPDIKKFKKKQPLGHNLNRAKDSLSNKPETCKSLQKTLQEIKR